MTQVLAIAVLLAYGALFLVALRKHRARQRMAAAAVVMRMASFAEKQMMAISEMMHQSALSFAKAEDACASFARAWATGGRAKD